MKTPLLVMAGLTIPAMGGPPEHAESPPLPDDSPVSFFETLFSGSQRLDAEVEGLVSDDIDVWRSALTYEQQRDEGTVAATLAKSWLEIDYEPTIVTFPSHRSEETPEGFFEFSRKAGQEWEISLGGRCYDGFPDYRSLWIAEFYDQFVGFLPGYEFADPRGWALAFGAEWDYLPRAGRLSGTLSWGRDHIVPGWSAEGIDLTRTRDVLDTFSGALRWETTLNPRLRMEQSARIVDVTERSLRTHVHSETAWAVTDNVTLRAHLGGAREDPEFEAWYVGAALDWEFAPSWHIGLSARLYDDSGEINSSNFNAAAPGMTSRELAFNLLWQQETTSLRISVGRYETRYDPLSEDNLFFGNLYRDREFLTVRVAYTSYF
jgi:hypothetical protein